MSNVLYTDAYRTCVKCNIQFSNTSEYFYHAKQKTKTGIYTPSLRSKCKTCCSGPKKEKVIITHKTCKTCNIEYPANTEYFRLKTDSRGCKYLYYKCKNCDRIYNSKRSLLNDHEKVSKLLGLSIDEYKTHKYHGWAAYKRKFPSSTYDEYLLYKNSLQKRTDEKRKFQRDSLTNNYVKQIIVKRSNIKVKDLDNYPELIEAYKINLLLKRKVYEKCN